MGLDPDCTAVPGAGAHRPRAPGHSPPLQLAGLSQSAGPRRVAAARGEARRAGGRQGRRNPGVPELPAGAGRPGAGPVRAAGQCGGGAGGGGGSRSRAVSLVPAGLAAALADRYRLERELGAGGMATVYLAHDLRHDRRVAVKVLRPELAAVIGAERFLAEIRTTANLQHPHILPLFDSGIAGRNEESEPAHPATLATLAAPATFLYYVMPYVEGENLRDRLTREKQLPIPDVVRIAKEVASALDYAHRHGVIHRDIKP